MLQNKEKQIIGGIGDITGIPIFEDKDVREGTYICLDKNNFIIRQEDFGKIEIAKIVVNDIETFKIAIKNNNLRN